MPKVVERKAEATLHGLNPRIWIELQGKEVPPLEEPRPGKFPGPDLTAKADFKLTQSLGPSY